MATPAVRRLARENNVDLAHVPGSGKLGRILKEDMLSYLAAPPAASATSALPVQPPPGADEWSEPLKGVAKAMVKSMTAAAAVPHLGYCDEIEMDKLMEVRTRLQKLAGDTRMSFLPFMIKAASLALKKYPTLNARISQDGASIIYRKSHNIGFALASPEGLLVPNVKNVQDKTLLEVAEELQRLIIAGRENKLSPQDFAGGSLTLSNIGTVGGTYTSPVLLLPEVVIGGLGKIQRLPRYDEHDNVVPVNIMNVSWSADHRLVDGMTIASFSNLWKQYLENPDSMLLEAK